MRKVARRTAVYGQLGRDQDKSIKKVHGGSYTRDVLNNLSQSGRREASGRSGAPSHTSRMFPRFVLNAYFLGVFGVKGRQMRGERK
jgi:hypothetical protein